MNREICFSHNADVTQSSSDTHQGRSSVHQGGSGVPPLKQSTDPMSAKSNTHISGETPMPPSRQSSTWHRQLLTVDFRHAFWPWVVYIAALIAHYNFMMQPLESENREPHLWLVTSLIGFSAAGVTVRIFCTDFAHATAERLLCNPVHRFDIWNLRLLLGMVLVLIPAFLIHMIIHIIIPTMTPRPHLTTGMFNLLQERSDLTVFVAWCIWSIGPLWCLVLRRPILAYAPIVLAPFSVLLVAALINQFNPPDYAIIAIILGLAAQFLAAHLWRRLEARQ